MSFNNFELNIWSFINFPVLTNIYIIQNSIIGTKHKLKCHKLSETQVYTDKVLAALQIIFEFAFMITPKVTVLKSQIIHA